MNLMQEEPNDENKVRSLKNSLIIIVSFAVVLIIIAVIIYIYSLRMAGEQFKVRIDGTSNLELARDSQAFIIENNKVYISIKDIASKIGYDVKNGEYKQYTEDTNSCYATNKNRLEIISFTSGSKEIRKYKAPFDNSEYKTFELEESIASRSGKLYICQDDMAKALNTIAEYDKKNNTLKITTLSYLTKLYEDRFEDAYLTKKEDNNNTELTDTILFNNQKALISNLVVVRDKETNLMGVSTYENNELSEVISKRYRTVEYIEGIEDFIVKTAEDSKYGIISKDGITKIKPEYDEIQEIDKNLGLYLYTKNGKKGIVNENGKTIVYEDYDQIGLDTDFVDLNVKNRFILYDKCIPVMVDKKWGLININGEKIVPTQYDGIGCKISSTDPNTTGIVIIPELEGIIVEQDEKNENNTVKKYGVIDLKGEIVVNIVAEEAYAVTIENKTTYYLKLQNQQIDIVSQWRERNNQNSLSNEQENKVEEETEQQRQNQNELSEEERNAIIEQLYQQMTDEQKQVLQQMSQEEQQQALQLYYEQYLQNQNEQ